MRSVSTLLVAIVILLVSVGIVMLASVSSIKGTESFGDPYYFLKRQFLWLLLSTLVWLVVIRFDYHHWRGVALLLLLFTGVLLVCVFIPPFGHTVKNSARWVHFGPMHFQPSELAKLTVVISLSAWISTIGPKIRQWRGLLIPLGGIGILAGLILAEPDFGTTFLIVSVALLMLFVGGARWTSLLNVGVAGLAAFSLAVLRDPVRLRRFLAFLYPEKYPHVAYHLEQSKIAFIKGSFLGVGLGNSLQKHLYLPEAHTDFIFAIIAEELGLLGAAFVLALYFGFFLCGLHISWRAPDPFGKLLAFGATLMVALQAIINIGVVTGCLPTKGIALPFISYGGSSLLASMTLTALLVNIALHTENAEADPHTRFIHDRVHHV